MKDKKNSMVKKLATKQPFYTQMWFKVVALVVLVAFFVVLWFVGTYNSLVGLEQTVAAKWAQVETQYQRRYDLLPNLVNSAERYMGYESEVLLEVTRLRSQWAAAPTVAEKSDASAGLESALSRLIVAVEAYPNLKADETFLNLMDELAGTENRVAVERGRYNDAVRGYNTKIKTFPTNIVANMYGFTEKSYFESAEGAEESPRVFE
jgi:LemA protein